MSGPALFRTKGYFFLALLLAFSLHPYSVRGQTVSSIVEMSFEHADSVAFLIACEDYTHVVELLDRIWIGERNDNPADSISVLVETFSLTTHLAKAVDIGVRVDPTIFEKRLKWIRGVLEKRHSTIVSPVDNFLFGTLEAAHAQYFNEIRNEPLKAISPAARSADAMEETLSENPGLIGAETSLALYHFWKSHVLRSFAWTPFVKDNREKSIATLYEVARSDSPYRVSSAIGLSWALIELDRPLEAAELADSMRLALGLEVRGLLEPAGKGYYLAGRWDLARERYESLLASLRAVSRMNPVREVGILHRLTHIAREQQDWRSVVLFADDALSLVLNDEQQDRKKDDLKRLKQLKQQATLELEKP